jgi:hypothetical protein
MSKSDDDGELDRVIAGWMILSAFTGLLLWVLPPRAIVRAHPASASLWLVTVVLNAAAAGAIVFRARWRDAAIDCSVMALVLCGLAGVGEWVRHGGRDPYLRVMAQEFALFLVAVAPLALTVRARTLAARQAAARRPPKTITLARTADLERRMFSKPRRQRLRAMEEQERRETAARERREARQRHRKKRLEPGSPWAPRSRGTGIHRAPMDRSMAGASVRKTRSSGEPRERRVSLA